MLKTCKWHSLDLMKPMKLPPSQICHRCGTNDQRTKRQFTCASGFVYKADLNGAQNILNRSLGYILRQRTAINPSRSPTGNVAQKGSQRAMEEAPLLMTD
ncbi:MAG: zinc ribbon domain-containing protein [Candidatus Heimdallarchaeota archaeon]